jgi:prolyl-tRNA editing enzyme YbaK/EbsC (Cys-tRNA(Pro) deacylase)
VDVPKIGTLATVPVADRPDLLAQPVTLALAAHPVPDLHVAEIDPTLADTAQFCAAYDVPPEVSANCVVVAGRRGGEERVEAAVEATGMEYGGITPIGLPTGWPILVDAAVADLPYAVIGSGVRRSKLALPGAALAALPGATVVDGLARPA